MNERTKLDGLIAARFYAAVMIVFFHVAGSAKLELPAWLGFISMNFGLGVPMFFIISAISLYIGYFDGLQTRDQLRRYFVRRFFRIAPLFYFTIALLAIYMYVLFGAIPPWERILTSVLFIFNFVPQHAGGYVWASWSIGIEMVFYAVLPILVFAVSNLTRSLVFFAISAYLAIMWKLAFQGVTGVPQLASSSVIAYLIYFAAGIVAYFLWIRIRDRVNIGRALLLIGTAAFAGLIAYRGRLYGMVGGPGPLMAVQTVPLMIFIIGLAIAPISLFANRITIALGEASFSLYLLHPFIIYELNRRGIYAWIYSQATDKGSAYLLCAALTMMILFPLSLLAYRLIEVPGNRAGSWVLARRKLPTTAPKLPLSEPSDHLPKGADAGLAYRPAFEGR